MQGLVVPVIRNAETMSFLDIEKYLNNLSTKVLPGFVPFRLSVLRVSYRDFCL